MEKMFAETGGDGYKRSYPCRTLTQMQVCWLEVNYQNLAKTILLKTNANPNPTGFIRVLDGDLELDLVFGLGLVFSRIRYFSVIITTQFCYWGMLRSASTT